MDEIEEIKKIILEHRGKTNAIKSREIANKVGINEDDTHAKTREIIRDIKETDNLPVLACNKGYYLAETEEEFNEYIENLKNRIKGIEKRIQITTNNYKNAKNE